MPIGTRHRAADGEHQFSGVSRGAERRARRGCFNFLECKPRFVAAFAVLAQNFRGYVKPANMKENRRDRRLLRNQTGKRKAVVIIGERGGNSIPAMFHSEGQAIRFIQMRVAKGTTINADEAGVWDKLHDRYEMKRINHEEAYSFGDACANWAEEFFSRMRRAEIGHHHHISGVYLLRYAQEAAWREDNRRSSNGEQVNRIAGLAMKRGKSVDFGGYWQRHVAA